MLLSGIKIRNNEQEGKKSYLPAVEVNLDAYKGYRSAVEKCVTKHVTIATIFTTLWVGNPT